MHTPPSVDELEVSLFGSGYGECVLIHIGNENWVIVDSCLNPDSNPTALAYLRELGFDPSRAVCLIVATHWHDDHIRGMGELVEACGSATFCCASALGKEDFLSILGALENRPATPGGSGARELYRVFSSLEGRSATCKHAIADRLIFNQDDCEIWSLSPSDSMFRRFLHQMSDLLPETGQPKRRISSFQPNDAAVVLLIKVNETVMLLGADLERKGWLEIIDDAEQSGFRASMFKVPHHGSKTAHEVRVWEEMLDRQPIAALTPWRRGGRELPTKDDAKRILEFTSEAYATALPRDLMRRPSHSRSNAVERTIRETGASIRAVGLPRGMLRLRKRAGSQGDWNVEAIGSACRLADYT